ncbi:hypothetical protein DM01DRAFT_1407764 [Hesseltinella vesiculosa]|uniref:DNA recombination and repair protein Rad51-like C-terminal domain-containing protein n=1 Tax=Hesseltinella vesiculosa TaxID=101127 RepID=A0A1X2GH34_9FUNG|nr:hypothetical protein DM01DRAFT_1407764 [Hesseltinella vesiculosa]
MPRLQTLYIGWTADRQRLFKSAISALLDNNIVDDEAFLLLNLHQLHDKTKIPTQILACLRQVLVHDIESRLHQSFHPSQPIPTSYNKLNIALQGGLPSSQLVELVGTVIAFLEDHILKLMQDFLVSRPQGHVYHIDTTGAFQSKLGSFTKGDLSRMHCYRAFDLKSIIQELEQVGAEQLMSSQQEQASSTLIVIEDIGQIFGSDLGVTDQSVKRLCKTIRLLLEMQMTIMISHYRVSQGQSRYDITWDNMVDLRLLIQSDSSMILTKARHVKTPQGCS